MLQCYIITFLFLLVEEMTFADLAKGMCHYQLFDIFHTRQLAISAVKNLAKWQSNLARPSAPSHRTIDRGAGGAGIQQHQYVKLKITRI